MKISHWTVLSLLILGFLLLSLPACESATFKQEERTFFMGMTPYPPDYSRQGDQVAYDFINTQCDLIGHHFDEGIPWEEALRGDTMPTEILEQVEKRNRMNEGRPVYLALTPLAFSRTEIAGYWGHETADSIKTKWENISLDDTLASTAYFNFCVYMIEALDPIFFNYGVESNSFEWEEAEFQKYLTFNQRVYAQLKIRYPDLPVFLSYMIRLDDGGLEEARQLDPFSDYVSVSSYPYTQIGSLAYGNTAPEDIPADWLTRYRDIDANKPFAVAETGYIAEDLDMSEYGLTKKGTPQWQADYLQQFFEECNALDAEFVIYWCAYDFDRAWNTLEALGMALPLFKTWRDVGLYDGNGIARPSLKVWRKWYRAEKIS